MNTETVIDALKGQIAALELQVKHQAELALRLQGERDTAIARAKAAEAWRKRAEESEPVAWAWEYCGINVRAGKERPDFLDGSCPYWPLYAIPKPAPVPEEWREVVRELADDLAIELDMRYSGRHQYPSELRKYEADMTPVNRARALLNQGGKP